jgi:hypothetical protein
MALQYSVDVRNAKLNAIETQIGPSPVMGIWTDEKPAMCSSPETGFMLARLALPDDWMEAAVNGVKSMSGEWRDIAQASGVPGYFRIYSMDGRCKIQGSIGYEMVLDKTSLQVGQVFIVESFALKDNNG